MGFGEELGIGEEGRQFWVFAEVSVCGRKQFHMMRIQ
ncbi:hypothetical protein QG37_02557 [Candidozyma auris]|uniref:Uncharacterized protein n=1 Tax=Candidozyma auris TaxID=498019 RepID=A0A0L0P2S0_CANAR|nr:hypothetical protein QG37_02557 [[Candida] auris]